MAIEVATSLELRTERLVLRRFNEADADAVVRVCADKEIAEFTNSIAHPYTREHAEQFIARQIERMSKGEATVFAMELADSGEVIGSVGMDLHEEDRYAELGYLVALAHWGRGYATEASREMIRHAFEDLGMHRVQACWYGGNPASWRVMEKAGFIAEGTLRQSKFKNGKMLDTNVAGILRDEWGDGAGAGRA